MQRVKFKGSVIASHEREGNRKSCENDCVRLGLIESKRFSSKGDRRLRIGDMSRAGSQAHHEGKGPDLRQTKGSPTGKAFHSYEVKKRNA